MKRYTTLRILLAALTAISPTQAAERIISGNGAITEIVCALGAQDQLVAVDSSSVYPEVVTGLPQIGYARQLSSEGVLSASPTLVLLGDDAGPPASVEQIASMGTRVVKLGPGHLVEEALVRIQAVGDAIGRNDAAKELVADLKNDLDRLQTPSNSVRPRVLFIYARGGGVMNVSGEGTAADSMIKLAGGENAVSGVTGYKPLTAEAAVAARPDVILVTTRGLEASGGIPTLLAQPGLNLTPAGENERVVVMDDLLLLGFGPRLGQAATELFGKLHPATAKKSP